MAGAADAHALIVSSSRLFTNYRHTSNALLVYDAVRRFGLPDDRIVLMLGGDAPCNPRNEERPSMYASMTRDLDLYPRDVEVDWRQEEVTVENALGVLTDRLPDRRVSSPRKRLRSTSQSRVLLYLTGHGGDEFLKFNDAFELAASELATAVRDAFRLGRFSELLLLIDTCQASSITALLHDAALMRSPPPPPSPAGRDHAATTAASPRIATFASSLVGENSFSHEVDSLLGVAVSDRFTFQLHAYLRRTLVPTSSRGRSAAPAVDPRLSELHKYLARSGRLRSTIAAEASGGLSHAPAALDNMSVHSFFGAAAQTLRIVGTPPTAAAAPSTPPPTGATAPTYARWATMESRALWGFLPVPPSPDVVKEDEPGGSDTLGALAGTLGVLLAITSWPRKR